jgi:hypothetical protein
MTNLRKARAIMADKYHAVRWQAVYRDGNLVLVVLYTLSSKLHQRSAKVDYRWSVLLVIAKVVSPVTVPLANPDTGVIVRKAHVSQLKQYFSSE